MVRGTFPANGRSPSGSRMGGFPADDYPPAGYPLASYPPADYPGTGRAPAQARQSPPGNVATRDPAARTPAAVRAGDAHLAMLAYLTVPFLGFLGPGAVYLLARRRSGWLRAHAAQALNVWLTGLGYALSAVIMGAVLVLDTPQVALAVMIPLVAALWLVALGYLARAAVAASRHQTCGFPRWLCSPMVR